MLWTKTYFDDDGEALIGALNETKLSSLDMNELQGWYVDERPQGYQINTIGSTSVMPPAEQNTYDIIIFRRISLAALSLI